MKTLEWGIYLIVFCLPLYLVRFSILGIPTTVLEVLIYVLFILWLIKGFKFGEIKKLLFTHYPLFIAILLILIGVSTATFYSWNLRTSLGIWKAWFIDPILFFIVFISTIKKPEQIARVFYCLICSGLMVSIISLIYLIQGKLDGQGRLQGFYNSPNYLAMYLAPVLIIGLGMLFLEKDYLLRRPLFIINLFLIIVLFFTKSFGAWLGIIGALILGTIIYLSKRKNKKIIWGVICLGLLIILIFGLLKINSIPGRLSLSSRLIIWQRAWESFITHPIIGIGPGTFSDYFPSYPLWGVPQPHNLYLAFLLQTGIFGFIGLIWLLIWFFRRGFKSVIGGKGLVIGTWDLGLILMSVMVYILIHGLVDTTYWKNDLSIFFWLVIGIMTIIKKEPQ